MSNNKLAKDDVIWVPYRRDPLWPALVHNSYPKKVTYCFFPLPNDGASIKKNTFSCHPKHAYALVPTEPIDDEAAPNLIAAFRAATKYLQEHGKTRGSEIESLGEAMARENGDKEGAEKWKEKRVGKKKREQTQYSDLEDDENGAPSPKKVASTSSERSSPSISSQPPITEEQSKEMMKLIDNRFETLVEKVLSNLNDLKKAAMREKMTVKLRNNQFLSDSDYESLFERLVLHIRSQHPTISLITAFSFTASHAIPLVLTEAYATWKNVEIEEAKEIFYQLNNRVLGLDTAMEIPVTDQMEELCRLACDEHNTI